jgi:hypothetical protein
MTPSAIVAAGVVGTVRRRGPVSQKMLGNRTPMLGTKAANSHQAVDSIQIGLTGTKIHSTAPTPKHRKLPNL